MGEQVVARLLATPGVRSVDADGLASVLEETDGAMVAVLGDPTKNPQTVDISVVLAEVAKQLQGRLDFVVVQRAEARAAKQALGLRQTPSVAFVRRGEIVETLEGMQDWRVFEAAAGRLIQKRAERAAAGAQA